LTHHGCTRIRGPKRRADNESLVEKEIEAIFLKSIQANLASWLVNLSQRRLFSRGAMEKFAEY
jgi:hypothetical protein